MYSKILFNAEPFLQSSIEPIHIHARDDGLIFSMLRLDQLNGQLGGNKLYKLQGHLQSAFEQGKNHLLSFGGRWSNHLHALSEVANLTDFKVTAIVRGLYPSGLESVSFNPVQDTCTLKDLRSSGVEIIPATREEYARYTRNDCVVRSQESHQDLLKRFGECWVIPEGGGGRHGIVGLHSLFRSLKPMVEALGVTHFALACGTGTTMAALISTQSLPVLGVQTMQGEGYLHREIKRFLLKEQLSPLSSWQVLEHAHCGGFGKVNQPLLNSLKRFEKTNNILLDPIYTAKLVYAMETLPQGVVESPAHILLVHTGGLQGRRGKAAWLGE